MNSGAEPVGAFTKSRAVKPFHVVAHIRDQKKVDKKPNLTLEALDWLRRSFCSKILEYFLRSFLIIWEKQREKTL